MRKIWLLVERLVHEVVELDRAGQVGAERLLHDDARAVHQVRVAQHGDHRAGGLRRHRKIVQPADVRPELRLGLGDGGGQRLGACALRHVGDRFGEAAPLFLGELVRAEVVDGLLGQLRGTRRR